MAHIQQRLLLLMILSLILPSLSLATDADSLRLAPMVREHLVFSQTPPESIVTLLLQSVNQYRQELRSGLQIAHGPSSQQNTEQRLLLDQLRAASYFDAELEAQTDQPNATLRYRIQTGQPYRIRTLTWDWPEALPQPLPSEKLLNIGSKLAADTVLHAQTQLRRDIQQRACYRSVHVRYELLLDRTAHAGDLRFYLLESPAVTIGKIEVKGAEGIRKSHIERLTQIQPGDCFQRPKLDQARLNLYESDLFARVDEWISEPNENNEVTVVLTVRERFHRTFKLGGGYASDLGIGLSTQWLHRNFDRRGERLQLGANINVSQQTLDASYTIPRRRPEWPIFVFSTELQRAELVNQESVVWQKSVGLEQRLNPNWVVNLGVEVRSIWLWDDAQRNLFEQFLQVPVSFIRETRDDILNPSSGAQFMASLQPTFSLSGAQPNFVLTRIGWQGYWGISPAQVLAANLDITLLAGLGKPLVLDELSITERLFAGGGGSVRGWDFQGVVPLNGGRTRILQSIEHRVRWSPRWGTVAFVDAAWLSTTATPQWFEANLGAGLGARYFTDFAPLRLDVASPLPDWGNRWRLYFSIGQSF